MGPYWIIQTFLLLLLLFAITTCAIQTAEMEPELLENEVSVITYQPKSNKSQHVLYTNADKTQRSTVITDLETETPSYEKLVDKRLFEGDIENYNASSAVSRNLTSILSYFMSWTNAQVPYVISPLFSLNERRVILRGMKQFHRKTCVQFTPRKQEFSYLFIQPGDSRCSSNVGRTGGMQKLNLGDGCLECGIIVHELMHTLGFWHEQSRPDRDEHVIVNWENILPGMELNFLRLPHSFADTLGLPYDLGSIMHYGPYAFSRDPHLPSLSIRQSSENRDATMGQLRELSKLDVRKINKFYGCSDRRRYY